jgi:hypothetical protein
MTEERLNQSKHTYIMCVLFGMWLQQPTQRKGFAKKKISNLFEEWVSQIKTKIDKEDE